MAYDEPKPDLVVEKSVEVGDDGKFIVNYTVTNIGDGEAAESITCKYVDGKLQETQPCPALAPGASHNGTFMPESCPCGATLNVTVCADNEDVVVESDETNNCEVNFVDCPPCKPDLIVTELTVNYDAPDLGGRAIDLSRVPMCIRSVTTYQR